MRSPRSVPMSSATDRLIEIVVGLPHLRRGPLRSDLRAATYRCPAPPLSSLTIAAGTYTHDTADGHGRSSRVREGRRKEGCGSTREMHP
jgi:hypothetical protein